MTIDWNFISALEGSLRTGYVPAEEVGQKNRVVSGVTIGCGIDLGQMDVSDLERLELPEDLTEKLKPYCGRKGLEAKAFLKQLPLVLTQDEVLKLNQAVRTAHVNKLVRQYDLAASFRSKPLFDSLPVEAQTVIASVAFQYGDLPSRCPRFWNFCVAQDWKKVVEELEDFGDAFNTRRRKEANYLRRIL